MTQLVNRHTHTRTVYIGRGTKWGNPYSVSQFGESAMARYLLYFLDRLKGVREYPAEIWIDALLGLEGSVLVCSCAPKPCHGDTIVCWLEAINERMGMQENFDRGGLTKEEAVVAGEFAIVGMLSHWRNPAQALLF